MVDTLLDITIDNVGSHITIDRLINIKIALVITIDISIHVTIVIMT